MKNYADLGGCYPPQPSASADNTLLDLHNSSYHTQPHPIIANYSTMLTEPEENNKYHFSIIFQVIIREIVFSFILFVSSSKTSRNRVARYGAILDQSGASASRDGVQNLFMFVTFFYTSVHLYFFINCANQHFHTHAYLLAYSCLLAHSA